MHVHFTSLPELFLHSRNFHSIFYCPYTTSLTACTLGIFEQQKTCAASSQNQARRDSWLFFNYHFLYIKFVKNGALTYCRQIT